MKFFANSLSRLHDLPLDFPENELRVKSIVSYLDKEGLFIEWVEHFPEVFEWIGKVHSSSYMERFKSSCLRGDYIFDSYDNPIVGGSFKAAVASVATSLSAANATLGGDCTFAVTRPPGHHALSDRAMGFCFFSNASIVARFLQSKGFTKVAIVDFDVHHGNGTQEIFYSDPSVFFVSIHQYPFYPGTGSREERGWGEGEGYTLNIPLPAYSGDKEYIAAFEEEVIPELLSFAPSAVVVSAGFDAWKNDPLGGMELSENAFFRFGVTFMELLKNLEGIPFVGLLEGGYDTDMLGKLVFNFVRPLL